LVPQTPTKKLMDINNNFWRIRCCIFARDTSPCPFIKIFGFKG